jgi:hypothetical protein
VLSTGATDLRLASRDVADDTQDKALAARIDRMKARIDRMEAEINELFTRLQGSYRG